MKFITIWLSVFGLTVSEAYAQNLYTLPNAANIENEVNAITGWSGPAAESSVTTNPQNGTYCILITSNSGGNRHSLFTFTATVGTTYDISIWARRGSNNSNSAFSGWTGFSGFTETSIGTTSWQQYNFTLQATATNPQIRVYASTGGPAGRSVYVDAITITAQAGDTQPPTAPSNLASSNTTSTATTLSWNASTDNIGVVSYQIRQNNVTAGTVGGTTLTYTAGGLSTSTTYNFNVVALDAAGNVSPASNTVQVTTLSGGGGGTGTPYTTENANLPTVDWQAKDLHVAGTMGMGTAAPNPNNFRLAVNGNIRTKELVVESGWSDFVFAPEYDLWPLNEVEDYIIKNGHLKDIPPAGYIQANGVALAEMNKRLLQKVEELMLYIIEMNKKLEELEKTAAPR